MLKSGQSDYSATRLQILDIEIDSASGTVYRSGEVIDLPDLSFRLLLTLASRAPALVSKDDLIAEVWGEIIVSDETLMQRVRLLRQALGDDGQDPRFVVSVRGRGYRMAAPVEFARAQTSGARAQRRWLPWLALPLLAAAIALFAAVQFNKPPPAAEIRTLAVLPFADLSAERNYGYFADGMQEELLMQLSKLDEIAVLSRTSTEQYRGTTESMPAIAESINADAIIEGSVRVSDRRLRIAVQLIAGSTDKHLWAETYDEELTVENVFAIQQRVASHVADALQTEYSAQPIVADSLPTTSLDAYNSYLLGLYHTFRPTPDNLALGVQYLERAIAEDPEFAEAYAALGWAYSFQGSAYGIAAPDSVFPKARDAAQRALELDDTLAEAHALYADILTWYDRDFAHAEVVYQRAMALDPENVVSYALFLSTQERHSEAIALMERSVEKRPRDDFVRINAGWRYLYGGRYADAVSAALVAKRHPDSTNLLGRARLAMGDIDEAIRVFESAIDSAPLNQAQLTNLAYAYLKAGRPEDAQPYIDQLEGRLDNRYVSRASLAAIQFAAGDTERGYQMLNDAVDARERSVIFLNVSPLFAEQRDDERFIKVLERAGLPARGSP